MATRGLHGPNPNFEQEIVGDPYGLTIVSHYTTTLHVAAGGVTTFEYASARPEKRRAELLNLRTIFVHWWLNEWVEHGGDLGEGMRQLRGVIEGTPIGPAK